MVTTDFGAFDIFYDELHLLKSEMAVPHDIVSPTGRHAIARISQRVVPAVYIDPDTILV